MIRLQRAGSLTDSCRTDPVEFAERILKTTCWPRQAELLRAVAAHPRVAVRSGHKVSKSCSATVLALWWAVTKPDGRVVLTATTNPQIRNIIWKELKRLVARSTVPLPRPADLPAIGMQWPDGREIIGFSTKESERMAGLSGANMLFIVDEASGVEEDIYEALEGNRAGGAHILLIGNPTQPAGTFFDAFHGQSEFWHTLHVSSEEAAQHTPHIPGLATKDWVDEKLREWGPDDPRFQVRVLGNFPDFHALSVISLHLVTQAQARHEDTPIPSSRLELGVDPAKFGDDKTVIVARRGNRIIDIVSASQLDEQGVATLVARTVARHHKAGEQPALVKVDEIGVGSGVLVALRHLKDHPPFNAYGVNVALVSTDEEKYFNLRTQLWFGLEQWLKDGGAIPAHKELEGDLLVARYEYDARGRYKVERKDEIKKRIGRSPDHADALALAVYTPQARLVMSKTPRQPTYRLAGMGRGY